MCGIAGFVDWRPPRASHEQTLTAMTRALHTRGPDDMQCLHLPDSPVWFGHTRLAVIDLSTAGRQPMWSAGGRYALVYNGEIYNHLELRRRLEQRNPGIHWRGHCDTETLLAAIEAWGLETAINCAEGMFAAAVWDQHVGELHLVRDRFGEKPLYWAWLGETLAFASELKALACHPDWAGNLNADVARRFLAWGTVPTGQCIYAGVEQLPAGAGMTVTGPGRLARWRHWDAADSIDNVRGGAAGAATMDETHIQTLGRLLETSVGARLLADVPVGVLFSGGIDSTALVVAMQRASSAPIRTFTVRFDAASYDESESAEQLAAHLGTQHLTLPVSAREALDVVTELPRLWDEPFADATQIPMALICRQAREHVTVCLAGDGGDELFGGYSRHTLVPSVWPQLQRFPTPLRAGLAQLLAADSRLGAAVVRWAARLAPVGQLDDKIPKLVAALRAEDAGTLYHMLRSEGRQVAGPLPVLPETTLSLAEQFMYWDTLTYLPEDILVKSDRAAMAVGMEIRLPFLDRALFDFAWGLPADARVRGRQGKWLLRQWLAGQLPDVSIQRPKQGFSVPVASWLRGPLRDWAGDLLASPALRAQPFVDAAAIDLMWRRVQAGSSQPQQPLWNLLMFAAWQAAWQP